jgi:hypothetical protein
MAVMTVKMMPATGTTLRFSREIPTAAADTPMPLMVQLGP